VQKMAHLGTHVIPAITRVEPSLKTEG